MRLFKKSKSENLPAPPLAAEVSKAPKPVKVHPIVENLDSAYGHSTTRERGVCVNKEGLSIPWMTYPFLNYLNQLNLEDRTIFEWGSGGSTLYFSRQGATVTTVDSSAEWYDYVAKEGPDRVNQFKAERENYIQAISREKTRYDIIVIDGDSATRLDCTKLAPEFLNPKGIIVFDNSDWYPASCNMLRDRGFTQIDFAGFGPINHYQWCTSLFFKGAIGIERKMQNAEANFIPGGREVLRG
jgi:hypothetical protein